MHTHAAFIDCCSPFPWAARQALTPAAAAALSPDVVVGADLMCVTWRDGGATRTAMRFWCNRAHYRMLRSLLFVARSYDPEAIPALLRAVALLLSRGAHDGAGPTGFAPPPPAAAASAQGSCSCASDEAPHALLLSLLRHEDSMARFEREAAAAGLAPRDVSAELLGGNDADDVAGLPIGAVRLCHLPRGALPRARLRAHRLTAPLLRCA